MNKKDVFGNAEWVTPDEKCQSPYIKGVFSADGFEKAEITVCGLGFYYLFINGKKVSDDLFLTFTTSYHKRKELTDDCRYRIIYQTYDVTEYLKNGKNAIGFLLGGGHYRYPDTVYGDVKVCFKLDITDKNGAVHTVVSDGKMKWRRSFIGECENFLCGETHDYTRFADNWCEPDFCDAKWQNVAIADMPETRYEKSSAPADKIIRTGKPTLISAYDGKKLYDIGENITGWAIVRCPEGVTEEIKIRLGEEKENDRLCDEKTWGQFFNIIPDGKERTVHPLLTWHGFRYVEVSESAEIVGFFVIHADIKPRTEFCSSDSVLNWIYNTYLRTQLDNMHCGVPSDCPTIERRGYTGDGQLCCEAAMLLLDSKNFYEKWINDIADSQNRNDGHVPYTAPYINSGGGPGGWGCAIVEVPYTYYKMYGETNVLRDNFDGMLRYFDFLDAHSENGLVTSELPGNWCLGDWCTAEKTEIPEPFVNTYFYIKSLSRAIEISDIISRSDMTEKLKEKREYLKKRVCEEFFDASTGDFCGAVQGANAFAIDIGLGDGRTLKRLADFYADYGMFDTGIFGTDIVPRILFENGYPETAYKLLSSKGKYSFANWMNQGATTFWEYWTGERSHNHPMFGAATRYLFTYILGIKQSVGSVGFKNIVISPADISLESAYGSLELESGKLSVSRKSVDSGTCFTVNVPNGVNASFEYRGVEKILNEGTNVITV